MPTGMLLLESSIEDTESGEVIVSFFSLFRLPEDSAVEAGLVNKESLGLYPGLIP